MKTNFGRFCLIAAAFSAANLVNGQSPTTLVYFNGNDGANPQSGLIVSGSVLYGTTYGGGSYGAGTVFSVNADGTGFNTIYNFTGGSDGSAPAAGLVLSGSMLYGTTELGGADGFGVVFGVNINGPGITNLYSFKGGGDGGNPEAGLVLSGNTLYGTAFAGGVNGDGAVFRVNTDGMAFTNIYSFSGGANGSNPEAGLLLAGNTLYGTGYGPFNGGSGYGTVFKVNIDGSNPATLYSFTGGTDGSFPEAGLILSGNTLYGTASAGGSYNDVGTVFSVNTNGGNFHSAAFDYSNGANPQAGLILIASTLYGTTPNGGDAGWGTIFQVNTNLNAITPLYQFLDSSDGASPEAGLAFVNNALYGTTQAQNGYGYGTVFEYELTLAPTLTIARNGSQVTLTWTATGFSLQSAPSLTGVYTNVPSATSPYTRTISGTQLFYRLAN
jgi:uncharacterized repeat protein (TIGR03803 family)